MNYTDKAPDKSRGRKVLYKKDGATMEVYCEDADQYQSREWKESPADFNKPVKELPKDPVNKPDNIETPKKADRSAMKKILDAAGVKYFQNAKTEKLEQLVKENDNATEDN